MRLAALKRVPNVLVVEDNPGDVLFLRQAFSSLSREVNFHVVEDGEKAMAFLRQEGEYANAPRPDIMLLDLNLPRMDGRDVLAATKSDPVLRCIPVLILSSSSSDDDVRRAYDLHANGYISKPMMPSAFREIARTVTAFWLDTAEIAIA